MTLNELIKTFRGKNMTKATRLIALLFISMITCSTGFAANVASVSKENFAQYGKEDAYWVVTVSCDDGNEHVVQRKTDQDSWCPKGSDSLCSEDKEVAYKNACSEAYTQQTKENQAEAAAKRRAQEAARAAAEEQRIAREIAAAEQAAFEAEQNLKNKIAIEEKLLRIEQERLALSQRQLEIERRIVEINDLLKTEYEDQ